MRRWTTGETVVVRSIARSDGTLCQAMPTIAIQDEEDLLAVFLPDGTRFTDNYAVPSSRRVQAVHQALPSARRPHALRTWSGDSVRLYLPDHSFSICIFLLPEGAPVTYYCDLQAPFVRTPLGIDTQDYALDVLTQPDGSWVFKDEAEFAARLEVGIDSAAHQDSVREAAQEFVIMWQHGEHPFDHGWESWRPPESWHPRDLPPDWDADYGTSAELPSTS